MPIRTTNAKRIKLANEHACAHAMQESEIIRQRHCIWHSFPTKLTVFLALGLFPLGGRVGCIDRVIADVDIVTGLLRIACTPSRKNVNIRRDVRSR